MFRGYVIDWAVAVPLLAVIITMAMTWWTHHQRATFEMIDRMYALCHTIHGHLMNDWRLMHIFTIDKDAYDASCAHITASLAKDNQTDFNELLEKERLLAIHLFIAYEQVFFHLEHTSWHLVQRRSFLKKMLTYFTERVLTNPRLKWFLETADAECRSLHLEKESALELRTALAQCKVESDPYGPFVKKP
jgi:hypothetical protein